MHRLFLSLLFLSLAGLTNAQSVLLEEKVDFYEDTSRRGPNRTHYHHMYSGWGMMFGITNDGVINTDPLLSHYFELGMRYKLKLGKYYSLGYELGLNSYNFCLDKDDENRSFPDTMQYDKEKVNLFALSGGLYHRINIDKRRGDYIGNFFDMGVYGEWNYASRYFYKEEYGKDRKRKVSVYNPDYLNDFNYGVFIRGGYNRYVVFVRYRLSEHIDSDANTNYHDLPPFNAGVQIGFHR
ncbi:MAG: hypothetical protein R6U19_03365 [Bacteroidales bacterium]